MKKIVELLTTKKQTISVMESCTGGALANKITNIAGSSNVFQFGTITYSNEFKIKMGVDKKTIDTYTVYSIEVANEMSKAISQIASSTYGIGITGQLYKKDTNNETNENNKVYISIYNQETHEFNNRIIEVLPISREDNKKIIMLQVEEMLEEILSE